MDNIRIAILSAYDTVCAYMDNQAPKALHYFDDKLHEYLKGTANTYSLKASARHEDSVYLAEGNKLAFRWRMQDYYLNIMSVRRDEYTVEVTAYSLNFELLNEQKDPYTSQIASSFESYLRIFDPERVINLGINEVSDKMISHDWEGKDTMLSRLFSLANVFDAEIEFIPNLNPDHSLSNILMNVYQKHSDTAQGVGTDNRGLVLRLGKEVSGVTKTTDITELYTAIRPTGKDGLTIASLNKTEYDADGNIEFQSPSGKVNIYAVQARDRFPSNLTAKSTERYIAQVWSYDTDNVNVLYGQALAELKKNCIPQVKYEVKGYFDTNIGDTVTIADEDFNPPLYLEARVTEQQRSFTNPKENKTTFDNFKELQSEIDPSLLKAMNDLIAANKEYACSILTDNGIIFKNGEGRTTLEASIMDVGKDITGRFTITWTKDGVYSTTGKTVIVDAASIVGKSVYRFEAMDGNGALRGSAEVTVTNVNDGSGKLYLVESSDDIIYRSLDGTPSRPYVDFSGFTQLGDDPEKTPFPGRFVIELTTDGTTWTTGYQSTTNESTVRYYLLWIFGDNEGNGFGMENGDALGATLTDVIQLRCRFYADNASQTLIGVKNVAVVSDGKPTGISETDSPPENPYEGMLWRYTGAPTELKALSIAKAAATEIYSPGTTYVFRGGAWEVYRFVADNIEADTFKGYMFDGAIFNNDFDFMDVDRHVQGSSKIKDGEVKIESNIEFGTAQQLLTTTLKYDGVKIESSGAGLGAHITEVTDRSILFKNSMVSTTVYDSGIHLEDLLWGKKTTFVPGALILQSDTDNASLSLDTLKDLTALLGKFKLISCNTPSAINTAQKVYSDTSLFGNYIVVGWGVNHQAGWYQWANGTAQYLQILNDGLYVNINADVVKSKPMKVLLYKFA